MSKLLDIILCSGVVVAELIVIVIGALLVQLIVYKLTGISLYNKMVKLLYKEVV